MREFLSWQSWQDFSLMSVRQENENAINFSNFEFRTEVNRISDVNGCNSYRFVGNNRINPEILNA